MKMLLGWLAVAFVFWWIITAPAGAAAAVHHIGALAGHAAASLAAVISHL